MAICNMEYAQSKPFIKWVGGKSQLLHKIRHKYPDDIKRYCEPFVGGGAVLFDVLTNFKPRDVLINDANSWLINTYMCIRDNIDEIVKYLSDMQDDYWIRFDGSRRQMYQECRDKFNDGIKNNVRSVEMAVLFIFLNKTCFNGLFRVNKNGLFNVPMGQYKMPPICDKGTLFKANHLLQNVDIMCGDFTKCGDFIDDNTFVYFDPPYRPLTKTAVFNSYQSAAFDDDQQMRLCEFVTDMSQKGARVVISNSDPKNVDENDTFFDDLYVGFNIDRILAKRMVNSKGSGRGAVSELLISNF